MVVTNEQANRDPTRTTTLRKNFSAEMYKRFNKLRGAIRRGVEENDALGLGQNANSRNVSMETNDIPDPAELRDFEFSTSTNKHEKFMDWLNNQVDRTALELEPGMDISEADDRWTDTWVRRSYSKGINEAERKMRKAGIQFQGGTSVEVRLRQPIHANTLETMFSRAFGELDGVTNAMSQQMSRTLANGLAQGWNPRKMATELNDRIDKVGIHRSRMIARTETIRAHNEAALNRYEQAGVEAVAGEAEWLTAGDMRVCPRCAGLEGTTFSIKQARNLIPLHPNCILSGQTRIETKSGKKKIRNVERGDKVLTHKGNYKKVTSTQKEKGYTGEYIRLKAHKHHKVSLTPDHPVLTNEGWVEAGELKKDQKIAVKGTKCKNCGDICEYWRETCSKSCSAEKQWENEETREQMEQSISEASAQMWAEKGGDAEWRKKVLKPAHDKTRELVKDGKHPLQKLWEEKPEEMQQHVEEIAHLGTKNREKNGMLGKTGSDHHLWEGGKDEYHRKRAEAEGNWQQNRKKAKKRDDYTCKNCGITENHAILDVHHINKVRNGGTNKLNNLITLCRSCHKELEGRKKKHLQKELGIITGGSQKQPIAMTDISELKTKVADEQPLTRWNLSVKDDESYVAGSIVVHNCRCSWLPVPEGEDFETNEIQLNKLKRHSEQHFPVWLSG